MANQIWRQLDRELLREIAMRAQLERSFGYDTKHATHLVRLMRMGLEILRGQGLSVRLPDAAELIGIRDGALSFAELKDMASRLQDAMIEAAKTSRLPAHVDRARVDELAVALMT